MKVRDLIEKLSACDPDAEVGHVLHGASGWVSAVSKVGTAEADGRKAVVLGTGAKDGTLFDDELGPDQPSWL